MNRLTGHDIVLKPRKPGFTNGVRVIDNDIFSKKYIKHKQKYKQKEKQKAKESNYRNQEKKYTGSVHNLAALKLVCIGACQDVKRYFIFCFNSHQDHDIQ